MGHLLTEIQTLSGFRPIADIISEGPRTVRERQLKMKEDKMQNFSPDPQDYVDFFEALWKILTK